MRSRAAAVKQRAPGGTRCPFFIGRYADAGRKPVRTEMVRSAAFDATGAPGAKRHILMGVLARAKSFHPFPALIQHCRTLM